MRRVVLLLCALPAAAKDCASCDLVPCGQCQEGCAGSSDGCDGTPGQSSRNKCANSNEGCHPTSCLSPPPPSPPGSSFCSASGWNQVWADEFDGTEVDGAKWKVQATHDGGMCRNADCVGSHTYLDGKGHLVLKSDNVTSGSYKYSTGAVSTRGRQTWRQSPSFRVCVSAQLPGGGGGGRGQGIWPAHWMMPDDSSCDPDEGEMDIMEMIDGDSTVYGTYHWQTTFPKKNCSYPDGHEHQYSTVKIPDFATQFHEYAVERGASHLAFVVDGVTRINITKGSSAAPLFWDVPWYLIINTAVGGGWPGEPSSKTAFPTYHVVDYVRVAQRG